MKMLFIVHGTVQGVGYRWLVKKAAFNNDVKGSVRNMPDGSVRIIAMASERAMAEFERDIKVDISNGPSVMAIEKYPENSSGFAESADYTDFKIEK